MLQLKNTPFHERTSALCQPQNWRKWAGYFVVGSYEHHIEREYWAIRNAVALIDVAPLTKYGIKGPDAERLLNRVTTRNISKMSVGQVYYTGWCDDEGKLIDDGTVSRFDETSFRLTAAEPNLRWLMMNAVGLDVEFEDQTASVASLSLQGPNSRAVLNRVCESSVEGLKYFRLMENKLDGAAIQISRTGYTGDLGYEIWMDVKDALKVWDALMEAGHGYGILPVGILALDMARVEAGLFMLDVDYTSASHAWIELQKSSPFEMGLGWSVALDKPGYFVGRRALEREKREGSQWKLVGIEIDWVAMEKLYAEVGLPPQIPGTAVRGSMPVMSNNVQVGYASTATWSPLLKKYVALAHLQKPYHELNAEVKMEITVNHQRKYADAKVVKLPFYDPAWKKK
ncbi:MAG: aminomethyltransferase family protein [Kiritimatiellaceae bacterium]|nr:aminomethyltransferase family protein [Kiritimatiellaceae bacterium]